MTEKIHKNFKNHIYLTVTLAAILVIINNFSDFREPLLANPLSLLSGIILMLVFVLIVSSPLFYAIHLLYKNLSKNPRVKLLQILLIPLIGSLAVPLLFEWKAYAQNDDWYGIGATVILVINMILYAANEILLFINWKKLK